jgi:hypothetical protein
MIVLHPNQFEINEAWIAFHLNHSPIETEEDGDSNGIALMDAASCNMFGTELVPVIETGACSAANPPIVPGCARAAAATSEDAVHSWRIKMQIY